MKKKKWQAFSGSDCPECGDVAEVYTDTGRDNWAGDDDEVRCVACKHPGGISVDEDGNAWIVWSEEGKHER